MHIFDGQAIAKQREAHLQAKTKQLAQEKRPQIAAMLFAEDKGSVLYSNLKKEAAERVGIGYHLHTFSLQDTTETVLKALRELNKDPAITGIIIQKPRRSIWQAATQVGGEYDAVKQAYNAWWQLVMSQANPAKDVDGLHPKTARAIEDGTWQEQSKVLPATVQASLIALFEAFRLDPLADLTITLPHLWEKMSKSKVVILGRSDLLGKPLFALMKQAKLDVEMLGKKQLDRRIEQGKGLRDAQVVISATGQQHLITGDLIERDTILIDVGEPRADIDQASVADKAAFLTPVPGGIGPLTVVCLMENGLRLAK